MLTESLMGIQYLCFNCDDEFVIFWAQFVGVGEEFISWKKEVLLLCSYYNSLVQVNESRIIKAG